MGCRVELVDGTPVGEVTEVAHLPAQDLLVIAGEAGEVLVPFISEFVPTVDVAARRIVIDPPAGLLDIEE
jgi:16S rRNA processing protein RimM